MTELPGVSLVRRIIAAPRLRAVDAARARIRDWLAEISAAPAGKTLARLIDDHPKLGSLLAGIADGQAQDPTTQDGACPLRSRTSPDVASMRSISPC